VTVSPILKLGIHPHANLSGKRQLPLWIILQRARARARRRQVIPMNGSSNTQGRG
jgi:hypothetical protein